MSELAALRQMIDSANNLLASTVEGATEDQLSRRPGPGLNPAGFLYFHVLRHWDRDVNILCRGQALDADAWHRGGFGDDLNYHPLGLGMRGLGTGIGYTDAEVDAVPTDLEVLNRYQQMLYAETYDYVDQLDEARINEEIENPLAPVNPFTISGRLQHLVLHTSYHTGDIAYAMGAFGWRDRTRP
jgi:hypothetical protein